MTTLPWDETKDADALLEALRATGQRVIDIFLRWDEDMSGAIDRKEFRQGMKFIARTQMGGREVPLAQIDKLFTALDRDHSGALELKELDKVLRAGYGEVLWDKLQDGAAGEIELRAKNKSTSLRAKKVHREAGFEYSSLSGGTATAAARNLRGSDEIVKEGTQTVENSRYANLDIDLTTDETPEEQLRSALTKSAVRVIDLLRDWDFNGDGVVSRREFIKGIKMLGLPGGSFAGQLFDSWDVNNSGTVDMRELNKVLRRGVELAGTGIKEKHIQPINIHCRRNWSRLKVDGASGVVLHINSDSALMRGALKSRPVATAEHETFEKAGPIYLMSGYMPPEGSPRSTISPGQGVGVGPYSPTRRYGRAVFSPPRNPDKVVADLLAQQTAASRARTVSSKSSRGRGDRSARPLTSDDSALYANGVFESTSSTTNAKGGFLPRVASATALDDLDAGPRKPIAGASPVSRRGEGSHSGQARCLLGGTTSSQPSSNRPHTVGAPSDASPNDVLGLEQTSAIPMKPALKSPGARKSKKHAYVVGAGGATPGMRMLTIDTTPSSAVTAVAMAPSSSPAYDASGFFGLGETANAVHMEAFGRAMTPLTNQFGGGLGLPGDVYDRQSARKPKGQGSGGGGGKGSARPSKMKPPPPHGILRSPGSGGKNSSRGGTAVLFGKKEEGAVFSDEGMEEKLDALLSAAGVGKFDASF